MPTEPREREMQMSTIHETLREGIRSLELGGIEEARLCAEHLLAHTVDCPRLELPLMSTRSISTENQALYHRGIERLAVAEPLQYVMGCTDFCAHDIRTDVRALIPRPETECLVQRVLDFPGDELRVVDVGTGTGCIAISLALARPRWSITAVELSPAALELARENAARHGAALRFAESDLLDDLPLGDQYDVIVANLPYVPDEEWRGLAPRVREYEPRMALCGGPDGLALVRRLVMNARDRLFENGRLVLEIGDGQADRVEEMLVQHGYKQVEHVPDTAGRDRVVVATGSPARKSRSLAPTSIK